MTLNNVPFFQVSGDAQLALTQFSTQFYGAYNASEALSNWAQTFGFSFGSRAIRTRFPIPVSASLYNRRTGDDKYRRLSERSLEIEPERWFDGIEELAYVLEAPDFLGWPTEPQRMAVEARRNPNLLVAQLLHDNPNLDFYKDKKTQVDAGVPLFSSSHPVNIFDSSFGTFTNLLTNTSIGTALFKEVFLAFATRKAANGNVMRLNPTHLLVPPNLYEDAKEFLASDLARVAFLEGGVGSQKNTNFNSNNIYRNSLDLVKGEELLDTDKIYFIDKNAPAPPWVVQDGGEPGQILFDKSSDYYKRTGKVALGFELMQSATACLPHAIMQATIS